MTNTKCEYSANRDEVLVAYLYDEIDPVIRAGFESHLPACQVCRDELSELTEVRTRLGAWSVPDASAGVVLSSTHSSRRWWQDVPRWAQVAAALLLLGVAAGLANLDVRVDRQGVSVRTGWIRPQAAPAVAGAEPAWRADLAALEGRLRTELGPSGAPSTAVDAAAAKTELALETESLARVRALIGESERRQQNELALRLADLVREVNAQRQVDLVRIDRTLGQFQNNTSVEVMRQRQLIDYWSQRVSQRQ